jgi:hypothetical protein
LKLDPESDTARGATRASDRERVGPVALLLPILVALLWWLRGGLPDGPRESGLPPAAVDGPPQLAVWSGRIALQSAADPVGVAAQETSVVARLGPLHGDPQLQAFDARVLRARLGLGSGQVWRLELAVEGEGELALLPDGIRLRGAGGELSPLVVDEGREPGAAGSVTAASATAPLIALLRPPPPGPVGPRLQLGLWGEPGSGPLTLHGVGLVGGDGPLALELVPESSSAARLPRSLAADLRPAARDSGDGGPSHPRVAELERTVSELEERLAQSEAARLARDRDFVQFQQQLVGLGPPGALEQQVRALLSAPAEGAGGAPTPMSSESTPEGSPLPEERAAEQAALDRAAREASQARAQTLNLLLRSEGVWTLELLEAGELHWSAPATPTAELPESLLAPRPHGTGPVVFRQLDDRGRLAGGIEAELLRLEGSRSGRTLTVVLERGAFLEGGEHRPFRDGLHRIELLHVDPAPFLAALPDLFGPLEDQRLMDDGRWSLPAVHTALNRLFEADRGGLRYRLRWLGGVVGDELRDLRLEVLGPQGQSERFLFADRGRLALQGTTVSLTLEGGTSLRGDERAPFLDGQMRLVLPRVDRALLEGHPLPGIDLAAPPELADAVSPAAAPAVAEGDAQQP